MTLAALAVAGALALPVPSFMFGRTGGNVVPATYRLAATGPATRRLSPRALRRLYARIRAEGFLSLPDRIECAGALPDLATEFVTVRRGRTRTTVREHGSCNGVFDRVFAQLEAYVPR